VAQSPFKEQILRLFVEQFILVISISRDLVLRSLFDQYQMQSSAAASTFFTLWADHRVDRVPATAFPWFSTASTTSVQLQPSMERIKGSWAQIDMFGAQLLLFVHHVSIVLEINCLGDKIVVSSSSLQGEIHNRIFAMHDWFANRRSARTSTDRNDSNARVPRHLY
jgi:hypothetical protein